MLRTFSWRQILYHGEIFGFLAAWAVGIIIALAGQANNDSPRDPEGLAVVSSPPVPPSLVK